MDYSNEEKHGKGPSGSKNDAESSKDCECGHTKSADDRCDGSHEAFSEDVRDLQALEICGCDEITDDCCLSGGEYRKEEKKSDSVENDSTGNNQAQAKKCDCGHTKNKNGYCDKTHEEFNDDVRNLQSEEL
jgi:CDGSH-type Zn-finger protein